MVKEGLHLLQIGMYFGYLKIITFLKNNNAFLRKLSKKLKNSIKV